MIWRDVVRPRLPVVERRRCDRHLREGEPSLDRDPVIPLVPMASGRLLVLVFLLHLAVSQRFASSSSSSSSPKVSLALYYETLCPYSANFIVNYLAKIFDDGLISIVDVDLVPYGNARIRNGTISCQVPYALFSDRFQHGPYECLLNTVEACAIDASPDLDQHFSFIYCVESLVLKRKYLEWESCFSETGVGSQAVSECYDNGHGQELELKYATQTDSLEPPHRYVPWVVVDGQPLYEDYENFEAYICKAYSGEPPEACSGLTVITNQEKESNGHVSYAGEMIRASTVVENDKMKIKMVI
ncbi:lysosomal thiol reductase [Musa troglodytarum]|uniref:Lysosomal thiol reductase n=1 Tax=Musa troglodytarum TaxID=320322 RepID=A0A9E7HW42_9LILI|nr:lysosomal thiol reductase [Musa troglodytarum]